MSIETLHASLTNEIRGSTNRDQRKLANNTYGSIIGDTVYVRLHATDIAVITPTTATYNTGGWYTVTTKERINRWLPAGLRVWSEKGIWRLGGAGIIARFRDGITITDGQGDLAYNVVGGAQLDDPDEPLRKALDRYVKLYTDERLAELMQYADATGARGDCLYCQMFDPDGKQPDHLLDHIAEGYTMAWLAHRAVSASGYKPDVYLGTFLPNYYRPGQASFYGDVVRRSIRKYLKARVLNRGLVLPDLELENA
jgi:hypothetical protein